VPANSFGELFKITTFGESHGHSVGVIVDGVPPHLPIDISYIQKEMNRRKPGQSEVTTPRKESDNVHIASGVFEGRATGTPIMLVLHNQDHDSSAYDNLKDVFRPGHADFTYTAKYGIRDFRGSGRSSGRETAGRVAAGAIAKHFLSTFGITITAYTKSIGDIHCETIDFDVIEKNMVRACDPEAAKRMEAYVLSLKEKKESCGGVIECLVQGLPPGIGEPVFDKLDALLAHAVLSVGATKGIEFGSGFEAARMVGSEHNDSLRKQGFVSNNAGGILGGISNGQDLLFRTAVKPTSSIEQEQETVDRFKNEQTILVKGRHDPCICPRIVPVIEAMTALVLADCMKRQHALHCNKEGYNVQNT